MALVQKMERICGAGLKFRAPRVRHGDWEARKRIRTADPFLTISWLCVETLRESDVFAGIFHEPRTSVLTGYALICAGLTGLRALLMSSATSKR